MEWMFLVTANHRARVDSRILQVLDHHMIAVQSFASTRIGNELRISLTVETDESNARRTGELLRKQHEVQSVDCFSSDDGLCRTLALFKVLCDQESRLPLLQVISSLAAQVVAVRPDCVTFQVLGTLQDIQGLRESLLPYGLVEAISVASAVVRKEAAAERTADALVESIPELLPKAGKREPATAARATA